MIVVPALLESRLPIRIRHEVVGIMGISLLSSQGMQVIVSFLLLRHVGHWVDNVLAELIVSAFNEGLCRSHVGLCILEGFENLRWRLVGGACGRRRSRCRRRGVLGVAADGHVVGGDEHSEEPAATPQWRYG